MERDLPDKYQPKQKGCHNINTRKIEYKAKILIKIEGAYLRMRGKIHREDITALLRL